MTSIRHFYTADEVLMKHERYLSILHAIGKNTHEAYTSIQKLEYQRELAKKNEKKNSMLLLKNIRSQRREKSGEEVLPYAKRTDVRQQNKQETWRLPLQIDVEQLSEEYMIPLKERYPDLDVDVHMNTVEDIQHLPPTSMYYQQMSELIESPGRSIPKLQQEIQSKRLEAENQRIKEEEEAKKRERKNKFMTRLKASRKLILFTNAVQAARITREMEDKKQREHRSSQSEAQLGSPLPPTLESLWQNKQFRKYFLQATAKSNVKVVGSTVMEGYDDELGDDDEDGDLQDSMPDLDTTPKRRNGRKRGNNREQQGADTHHNTIPKLTLQYLDEYSRESHTPSGTTISESIRSTTRELPSISRERSDSDRSIRSVASSIEGRSRPSSEISFRASQTTTDSNHFFFSSGSRHNGSTNRSTSHSVKKTDDNSVPSG